MTPPRDAATKDLAVPHCFHPRRLSTASVMHFRSSSGTSGSAHVFLLVYSATSNFPPYTHTREMLYHACGLLKRECFSSYGFSLRHFVMCLPVCKRRERAGSCYQRGLLLMCRGRCVQHHPAFSRICTHTQCRQQFVLSSRGRRNYDYRGCLDRRPLHPPHLHPFAFSRPRCDVINSLQSVELLAAPKSAFTPCYALSRICRRQPRTCSIFGLHVSFFFHHHLLCFRHAPNDLGVCIIHDIAALNTSRNAAPLLCLWLDRGEQTRGRTMPATAVAFHLSLALAFPFHRTTRRCRTAFLAPDIPLLTNATADPRITVGDGHRLPFLHMCFKSTWPRKHHTHCLPFFCGALMCGATLGRWMPKTTTT
jgi:hypothetical protein